MDAGRTLLSYAWNSFKKSLENKDRSESGMIVSSESRDKMVSHWHSPNVQSIGGTT